MATLGPPPPEAGDQHHSTKRGCCNRLSNFVHRTFSCPTPSNESAFRPILPSFAKTNFARQMEKPSVGGRASFPFELSTVISSSTRMSPAGESASHRSPVGVDDRSFCVRAWMAMGRGAEEQFAILRLRPVSRFEAGMTGGPPVISHRCFPGRCGTRRQRVFISSGAYVNPAP